MRTGQHSARLVLARRGTTPEHARLRSADHALSGRGSAPRGRAHAARCIAQRTSPDVLCGDRTARRADDRRPCPRERTGRSFTTGPSLRVGRRDPAARGRACQQHVISPGGVSSCRATPSSNGRRCDRACRPTVGDVRRRRSRLERVWGHRRRVRRVRPHARGKGQIGGLPPTASATPWTSPSGGSSESAPDGEALTPSAHRGAAASAAVAGRAEPLITASTKAAQQPRGCGRHGSLLLHAEAVVHGSERLAHWWETCRDSSP